MLVQQRSHVLLSSLALRRIHTRTVIWYSVNIAVTPRSPNGDAADIFERTPAQSVGVTLTVPNEALSFFSPFIETL
jgi:hypothetical protein